MSNPARTPNYLKALAKIQFDPGVMYLTPKDVAKECGVDRSTVCRDVVEGKLKALRKPNHKDPIKPGTQYYIHPDDFSSYYRNPESESYGN